MCRERCDGRRRRTADEDALELKGCGSGGGRRRCTGQGDRQGIARRGGRVTDDGRRRTVADAAAAPRRRVVDHAAAHCGTTASMIRAATMFGACAMFSRLRVAQVLLFLPLSSTILKPYLHLHTIYRHIVSRLSKPLLPRDAMRTRGLSCRPVSVRLSVTYGGLYPDG